MNDGERIRLLPEDRFNRFRRITWWEQSRLSQARVLVLGAGALGNEILKNLALLGVGHIFVADFDLVEDSNLSRSILYRAHDCGRPKAEVAAQAVKQIYQDIQVQAFHGDIIYELGLGVYDWADVVIAGLDNREVRLHVNRCCWKTGTPWIDGATETLAGVVRVFVPPSGSCYECTLTETDWQLLQERRGCAGLRAMRPPAGAVPTTPVTASLIAALQCQEAIKLIHHLAGLAGQGLVFNGMSNDFYVVPYQPLEGCNSHETFSELVRLTTSVHTMTLRDMLAEITARLGVGAVLELNHEVLVAFRCPHCQTTQEVFKPLGSLSESAAACSVCARERQVVSATTLQGTETFLDRTLGEAGVPPFDVVVGRRGFSTIAFLFEGDAPATLGALY